ncbi:unnamed protein product [Rhodiola kirilowii]
MNPSLMESLEANLSFNSLSSSTKKKKNFMCLPPKHPGSFRCSNHKLANNHSIGGGGFVSTAPSVTNRMYARNSVVPIGTVKKNLVKRALAARIGPSAKQRRQYSEFQPRLTRLSHMSTADDIVA